MDCPNCQTPWKCNGPHLIKKYEGLYHSTNGYFIYNTSKQKYLFIPYEKEYDEKEIIEMLDILKFLNREKYKSQKKRIDTLKKQSGFDQNI